MDTSAFSGWALVELMGHRQRAGQVCEVEMCGSKLLRIDMPTADGAGITEFYGGSAIFSIRPCSEDAARRMAAAFGDTRPVVPLTLRDERAGYAHDEFADDDDDEGGPWRKDDDAELPL